MPKSIFIHEKQPSLGLLIDQGTRLWHEEVQLRPGKSLEKLWHLACELMDKELHQERTAVLQRYVEEHKDKLPGARWDSEKSSEMMSAHDRKLHIVSGFLVPKSWDSPEPYPYQGLFISAFYFLEAKNLFEDSNAEASWVSLTQAYYYLGMNSSTLTAHESSSGAVKSKHAKNSKAIRKVIVTILAAMSEDASIKSGAEAMKRVVKEVKRNPDYMAALNDFDSKSSEKTKISKSPNKTPKSVLTRLYDRLEEWSSPRGPYPDVADAFLPFKRGQRFAASKEDKSSTKVLRPKKG